MVSSLSRNFNDGLFYSFINTLSISLFSDFGIKYTIPSDIISSFISKLSLETKVDEEIIDKDKLLLLMKNIEPITGVYSTCNITDLNQEKKDLKSPITISDKNTNKLITPKNQGLLIINQLNLVNYLHHNSIINPNEKPSFEEKLLSLILLYSAIEQVNFTKKYLKTSEGFYKNRIGDLELLESSIEETSKDPINLEDQGYMLLAFSKLYNTIENKYFSNFFPGDNSEEYQSLANDLLFRLKSEEYSLIDLDTHSLTSIISCISLSYNILNIQESYDYILLSLSDELYSREVNNGFLLRYKNSDIPASLATHFKGIDALVDSYSYLDFHFLVDTAEKIYDNLQKLWDEELGLFRIKKNSKLKYTSKNIAFGLRALSKLNPYIESQEKKDRITKQLHNFFEASIKSTGLQISPKYLFYDELRRETTPSYKNIYDFLEDCKGSMILKGFKLYHKKNKMIIDKTFDSEHTLFISDAMFQLYKKKNV